MPPRLYYWLALGMSLGATGVPLMVNHYNTAALVVFSAAFLLLASGAIAEIAVPFFRWQLSSFGKVDRQIQKRITEARGLLRSGLGPDEYLTWVRNTQIVMRSSFGPWSPEYRQFDQLTTSAAASLSFGDRYRQALVEHVYFLMELRKRLRERAVVIA